MSKGVIYQWCPVQQAVVERSQVLIPLPANVAHGFIQDEMAATKHPIDGRYYTSKAKFRAVTNAHGYEEIGTAYENGYDPEVHHKRDADRVADRIWEQVRHRLNE